jgi:hypothetical protein
VSEYREMGEDERAEIADRAGEDFSNDGVVDVDVEGGLAIHG